MGGVKKATQQAADWTLPKGEQQSCRCIGWPPGGSLRQAVVTVKIPPPLGDRAAPAVFDRAGTLGKTHVVLSPSKFPVN